MKQLVRLLLCIILTVFLAGCADTPEQAPAPNLSVGFGRTDITPEFSVYLGGYFSSTGSIEVLDPLYASCIAFTDSEDQTLLLFHVDLCNSGGSIPFARKAVSKATGLDINNIMVAATHTHSGPQMDSADPIMMDYYEFLEEKLVQAAQEALADRKPAEMYATTAELVNLNFVRHYRMDDGSVVGDNFGNADGKKYVKHVREADNEMQLIRFKREGGKDVVLVNWQVHPLRSSSSTTTHISADLVGAMRMEMEPVLDCYMAYFCGASGNISPASRITSENITQNYLEQGALMAQEAILACDSMVKYETGKIQILRQSMQGAANSNVINLTTYAFSIGDIGFITAPYEMFDTNGKYIKDNSPFEMTFVVTQANGSYHYIPAEWAYEYGYACYEMTNGGFNKGVAEELASNYVDMLNQLYPTRK